MDRREFAKLMVAAGVAGAAEIPWGISRAVGQTRGGTLNAIIQPEPPVLVTAINQQQPTLTLGGKIYEGLLRYGTDLKPMPGLAQSWTVSPDGKTYTFKLFPNITFHDGKPCTAEDVIFTCTKMLMETHPRARGTFQRVEKAEAPDPLTVVFTLKEPFAPFLSSFDCTTTPIQPKHIYDGSDYRNNPANARAIGTGPFKLKEWVRGSHVHLVRHEGYYRQGEPHLDEIIYRVIPDAASRSVALEKGTVQLTQWTDVEFFDVPRLKALPHLEMTTRGYELFAPHLWIELNNRIAPMNDKRFRQAVAHALDKTMMKNRLFFGLGKEATGPISSKTRFYDGDVRKYEYSLEKARALLDDMGLKAGAGGKRVTIKFLVVPFGEIWQRIAEFVRQSLGRVGIEVILEATDVAGWGQKVSNWEYEMTSNLLYQLGDPALGVSRTYVTSNIRKGVLFSNTQGYSNPEADKIWEAAAVELNEAKRQALYSQVQKIVVEDIPVVWLIEQDFPTFHDKKLKNVITSGIGVHETFGAVQFG